jgi:hypothetical protein
MKPSTPGRIIPEVSVHIPTEQIPNLVGMQFKMCPATFWN